MTRGIKRGSSQKTGDTSAEQPAYPSATASQTRNCFPTCTRLVGAPAIYLSSSNERHSLMQRTSDNGAARYLHSCRTVLRIASCANNNAELSHRRRNRHRSVLNLCLLIAFHLIQPRRRNGEQRCVRTERKKIALSERGIYHKEIRICLARFPLLSVEIATNIASIRQRGASESKQMRRSRKSRKRSYRRIMYIVKQIIITIYQYK